MVKIDTKVLAKQLKESADYLADHKEQSGCYHFNTVEMDDKGINKNVEDVTDSAFKALMIAFKGKTLLRS